MEFQFKNQKIEYHQIDDHPYYQSQNLSISHNCLAYSAYKNDNYKILLDDSFIPRENQETFQGLGSIKLKDELQQDKIKDIICVGTSLGEIIFIEKNQINGLFYSIIGIKFVDITIQPYNIIGIGENNKLVISDKKGGQSHFKKYIQFLNCH
ncbi:hypothetical protein PPERSA_12672 [Pseudocohnilembus persalinus]|uniref:Uncharacterized protein n=1 Tax=Pseudocohnilembus persalinus TaxID=266149 RepID=A0A0V0QMU8_PSEPJ|nr:hypothetical protein PPERSA_12672 [Pseudocohnilembus persalinus]|eukprot:KRX03393.1 hypothetical protein PPERSA_12672 [Pseudocohnilembus persalinus]